MFWALAFIVALASLVSYDVLRQTVHVPAALRYVSTNASAMVFTRDLAATWGDLEHHVRPIFKQPRSDEMQNMVDGTKDSLAAACIAPQNAAALNRYGIDSNRGAVVAFIGQLQTDMSQDDLVAVLPITGEVEFSQTLATLSLGGAELTVEGDDADRNPAGFRLRRPTDAGPGRLCALDDGQLIEISAEPREIADAELYFVPDWFGPSTFQLECVALYENGEEGACTCELDSYDFEADSEDCLSPVNISPSADSVDEFRAGEISVEGLEQPALRGIYIPDTDITVVFTEDRWAIIAANDKVLAAALADPDRNLAYHRNSDTLRSLSVAASQHGPDAQAANSSLAGSIRMPWLYSTSPISFNLDARPTRLSLELALNLPSGSTMLIDRLTRSPDGDQVSDFVPYGSKVALALADRHLAYYIRYLFEYVDGAFDRTEIAVGHLAAAIQALSDVESLEALTLTVPALREGIPEFALVARLGDAVVARKIILDLQRSLRRVRDVEILERAIDRYTLDNNAPPSDLERLYSAAGEPYLVPEPDDTWASYRIEGAGVVWLELSDDVFATDSYVLEARIDAAAGETAARSVTMHYLLPPVTDNDFRYRYEDLQEDETDRPGAEIEVVVVTRTESPSAERDALRAGENRLCAAYDRETGSLWIGSDAAVLDSIFRGGAHMQQSGQYLTARQLTGDGNTPKGALFAHTGWILDQALAHPNEDVAYSAEGLIDFSDYEQLLVTITAQEERNGIKATIELLK